MALLIEKKIERQIKLFTLKYYKNMDQCSDTKIANSICCATSLNFTSYQITSLGVHPIIVSVAPSPSYCRPTEMKAWVQFLFFFLRYFMHNR